MNLAVGLILLLLLASVSAGIKPVHKERRGEIVVKSTHVIEAGKGEKISISIRDAKLHNGGKFKLEDYGINEVWIYESTGDGRFDKYQRGDEGNSETVTLPIRIVTESNQLAIKPRRFFGDDYVIVEYLSGNFAGCLVSDLDGEDGRIRCQRTVDDEPLYPTATSCDIQKDCREERRQINRNMTCEEGIWQGDVRCKLDEGIVHDKCNVTFGEEELELSTGCPYDLDEVVNFYIEEEGLDNGNVGRSRRRRCEGLCGCGRYRQKMCLLCERLRRCRGRTYLG